MDNDDELEQLRTEVARLRGINNMLAQAMQVSDRQRESMERKETLRWRRAARTLAWYLATQSHVHDNMHDGADKWIDWAHNVGTLAPDERPP